MEHRSTGRTVLALTVAALALAACEHPPMSTDRYGHRYPESFGYSYPPAYNYNIPPMYGRSQTYGQHAGFEH